MYLHLGQNVVVPESAIIGIFDLDNTTGSFITRKYLNQAELSGRLISVSDDIPKSFIVCDESREHRPQRPDLYEESGKTVVYLSQLSSQTLLKRSEAGLKE